jgi:hypothetical protein
MKEPEQGEKDAEIHLQVQNVPWLWRTFTFSRSPDAKDISSMEQTREIKTAHIYKRQGKRKVTLELEGMRKRPGLM